MELPEELLYSKTHEWIRNEAGVATVGITDYAQSQLKDIVFVEMPEIGARFKREESIGVVESVKTVADLYSPVAGRIVQINGDLKDHPQYVNEDPYRKGWIVKIELENKEELTSLLSAKAYQGTLTEED